MKTWVFSTKGIAFMAVFCFWILSFFLLEPVYAQAAGNIRFERISMEQGLYQVTVSSILQDRQGFMWFATQGGLNKYDGYEFTVYRHDPDDSTSLSNNLIRTSFEDAEGHLWIGTEGGLNKFDRKKETFTRYLSQADNPRSISNNKVKSIFEDISGNLWIGTDGGLNNLDRKTGAFTRYLHQANNPKSISHNQIRSIFEDSKGNMWIGTDDGLNNLDRKTGAFTRYLHQADNPTSISHTEIRSIFEDSKGNMWIGTFGGGLNKFDRKTETFTYHLHQPDNPTSLSHNAVFSIFEDGGGTMWVGTNDGLNKFNRDTGTFTRYLNQPDNPESLSDNTVFSIFEDTGGNLWVGTFGGGLNRFNRKTVGSFIHHQNQAHNPNSLNNNFVWSFFEDTEDNLWIGTYGGGLNKFDRKTGIFTHYLHQADNPESLSDNSVFSIIEDAGGTMWIGVDGGLNRFDRKTGVFTLFKNQADNPKSLSNDFVMSILEDSRGNLWIGTYGGGLNKFDRNTETFTHYLNQTDNPNSISNNFVSTISEDTDGNLWIGTYNGLNKYDQNKETFTRYLNQADNLKSISDNHISKILDDSRGNLWIGTDGGLNRFNKKAETFTCYREKDGLPDDTIYGILEDSKGNLWLTTNRGIAKFNPKTKTSTNYDKKDGLQSNEFTSRACYKDRAGRMYFGGINGFNEFRPDDIRDNKYIPPVTITDFMLFNKSVKVAKPGIISDELQLQQHINFTKEIILGYKDYIFTFEFSVLNYRQSEKNQFAYKLEGFNKDWVETNYRHRRVTYTDLYHGEYIFKVKGSNDDGYWNKEGASIKLTILPPPWKTWWAYSLYALAALGLLSWFIVAMWLKARRLVAARVKKIEEEKEKAEEFARMLEIKVEDRTRELKGVNKELKNVNEDFREVNEQLGIANERLRKLEKMKSKFFANISHELRTPLTLILAPVDAMLGGDLGELAEEHVEQINGIQRSALKLLKHINDLLDLSRMEEARLPIKIGRFSLKSHLIRILDFARPMAERKKIEIVLGSEEDVLIEGDEEKLERVFVNLLSNALKFTDSGGKISIRTQKSDNIVKVSVQDTGIGITKENLEMIFDRFGQVDQSMTQRRGGSGIGLSMAKELVELHRGRLTVTSELGQGSTFVVEIPTSLEGNVPSNMIDRRKESKDVPVKRREQDKDLAEWTDDILSRHEYRFMDIDKATERRLEPRPKTVELKSARLLVVDDNVEVLRYLQQSLQGTYDVWTAQDGKEAWELLLAHRHDLAILDIKMPEMSGLELTHRIRKDARTQDMPVILLTARDGAEHRVEGHAVGADQYFTKPFNLSELRVSIKSLLSSRSRRIESGARRRSASMETLLGGMAHELHNACHQVQSSQSATYKLARRIAKKNAETLPESNIKTTGRLDQMESICHRALERISVVVHSLKRYTSNQMQAPWETIDIDKLIARGIKLITTAEEKGVEIKLSLHSGVYVRGPEEEIRQMVLNLVENAVFAVSSGGLIEIKTTLLSGKVHLVVSDNGSGIPVEKKEQVFDPFFTTKDPGQGMGLGLSLCKRTIVDLGGEIELRSEEGVGTQILVELPIADVSLPETSSP
ncbi:MAG: response regulator [Proteobacteria bacterium]|nr:response regulator [Pseudomonadota bacterium]